MIQALRNILGFYKTIFLRKVVPGWRTGDGGGHELHFWEEWIRARATLPDDDFQFRIHPQRPMKEALTRLLPQGEAHPSVLDVGYGPLSNIGIQFSGGEAQLTGADPLAKGYREILSRSGIRPNCYLVACAGEELIRKFGHNQFDLVCAINSLDHSRSPVEVFRNMAGVCKVGGHLYFSHFEDEGLTERYAGMHQWNLGTRKDRLVVDDGRVTLDFQPERCGLQLVSSSRRPAGCRMELEWILKKISDTDCASPGPAG